MAKFAQGRFNMKNPDKYVGGKTPLYRSSWEFAFMRFCDESPSIQKWASESIRIHTDILSLVNLQFMFQTFS